MKHTLLSQTVSVETHYDNVEFTFYKSSIFFLVHEGQPSHPSLPKPSEVQTKEDSTHSVNTNFKPVKAVVLDNAPTERGIGSAEPGDASTEPVHREGSHDASVEPSLGGSRFSELSSQSSLGGSSVVVKYTLVESEDQPERVCRLSLGEHTNSDTEGLEEAMEEEEEVESEDEKQDSLAAHPVIYLLLGWRGDCLRESKRVLCFLAMCCGFPAFFCVEQLEYPFLQVWLSHFYLIGACSLWQCEQLFQ